MLRNTDENLLTAQDLINSAEAAGKYIAVNRSLWGYGHWRIMRQDRPTTEDEYNQALTTLGESLLKLCDSLESELGRRHGWSQMTLYLTAFILNALAGIQSIEHGAQPVQYMNIHNPYLNGTVVDPYYNETVIVSKPSPSLGRFDFALQYINFLLPLTAAAAVFIGRQVKQTSAEKFKLLQVGCHQFNSLFAERNRRFQQEQPVVVEIPAPGHPGPG